jgi:hypothetical protein
MDTRVGIISCLVRDYVCYRARHAITLAASTHRRTQLVRLTRAESDVAIPSLSRRSWSRLNSCLASSPSLPRRTPPLSVRWCEHAPPDFSGSKPLLLTQQPPDRTSTTVTSHDARGLRIREIIDTLSSHEYCAGCPGVRWEGSGAFVL